MRRESWREEIFGVSVHVISLRLWQVSLAPPVLDMSSHYFSLPSPAVIRLFVRITEIHELLKEDICAWSIRKDPVLRLKHSLQV